MEACVAELSSDKTWSAWWVGNILRFWPTCCKVWTMQELLTSLQRLAKGSVIHTSAVPKCSSVSPITTFTTSIPCITNFSSWPASLHHPLATWGSGARTPSSPWGACCWWLAGSLRPGTYYWAMLVLSDMAWYPTCLMGGRMPYNCRYEGGEGDGEMWRCGDVEMGSTLSIPVI